MFLSLKTKIVGVIMIIALEYMNDVNYPWKPKIVGIVTTMIL